MDAEKPKDSIEPPDRARLRDTIAAFPGQPFAVVDGAHFEDVTALFKRERLFARSLFLDTADHEAQNAGPWLVALDQAPDATEQVVALVGDKPAAVYWSCRDGETVLWRHLRSINMVSIPDWAACGGTEPPTYATGRESFDVVMFRHWDPRVLGGLVPCFEQSQFSRILGPAEEISFDAPDYGGLRRILYNKDLPRSPPGLLRIRSGQIVELSVRRTSASNAKIADFLYKIAEKDLRHVSAGDLMQFVASAQKSGAQIGLKSEISIGRWAYIILRLQNDDTRRVQILNSIVAGPGTIEKRLLSAVDIVDKESN